MNSPRTLVAIALLGGSATTQEPLEPPTVEFRTTSPFAADELIPHPAGNEPTLAAFDLGRRLFEDPILSSDRTTACLRCHRPEHGFASAEPFPPGVGDKRALRHAPSLYNRAFGSAFSWDGKASTLEEQSLLPIENPNEMDLPLEDAIARLRDDASYREAFRAVYDDEPTAKTLGRALATFVRSITIGPSPVDRFLSGDRAALSVEERAGMWIYESKGRCWKCHVRPTFTDEQFHNTGIGLKDGAAEPGREAISGERQDRGAFKTPSLRGLAFSAPYMHDGSIATLDDVVEFYRGGANDNADLDRAIQPIDLTDEEATNLVTFLRALSRPAQ